jgi:hypothetical protein
MNKSAPDLRYPSGLLISLNNQADLERNEGYPDNPSASPDGGLFPVSDSEDCLSRQ